MFMHSGLPLAAWLSDSVRRDAAQEQATTFTARWTDHPLFADLNDALRSAETVPPILAAAERFMARLPEIEALIGDLVSQAAADPFFMPPLTSVVTEISTGYLLFADRKLTISLGVISPDGLAAKKLPASGTSAIPFTGMVTSYRFLKSGGALMSFWEADSAGTDFTGDIERSCRFAGRARIEDDEALVLEGRRQSLVIEHLSSEMLCLQATVQVEAAPLAVDYDSVTQRYLGAASTDEAASRTQMMVTLLRLLDYTEAVPAMEHALASPHFYTRWHVMREMLALDADAALPALRRMARRDPHPEVRFAATQTLSLFFNEEAEELRQCRA
jgi:hypothetical protein